MIFALALAGLGMVWLGGEVKSDATARNLVVVGLLTIVSAATLAWDSGEPSSKSDRERTYIERRIDLSHGVAFTRAP